MCQLWQDLWLQPCLVPISEGNRHAMRTYLFALFIPRLPSQYRPNTAYSNLLSSILSQSWLQGSVPPGENGSSKAWNHLPAEFSPRTKVLPFPGSTTQSLGMSLEWRILLAFCLFNSVV